MSAKKKTQLGGLGAVLLVIWALPGIGIPSLLIFLYARKRQSAGAAPVNERGQYR